MKIVLKIIIALVILVVVIIAGGLFYLNSSFPKVGEAKDVKVEITPERLVRGEYLVNNVALCVDCHGERDFNYLNGPLKPGTKGSGGEKWTEEMGLPGTFYALNITPAAIGDWTDGELIRTITTGVNKDGRALFPIMPYMNYRTMDQEDLYSIVAYIRSLDPVEKTYPEAAFKFPFSMILKTIPKEADLQPKPDTSNVVAYGKYIVTMASCNDCHTPMNDKGQFIEGMYLAGGQEFPLPGGIVRPMNITPDKETGIGEWDKQTFIERFKMYDDPSMHEIPVAQGEFNSLMPWLQYAGMTERDLGAIYEYLRTVPPVKNQVERWTQK